MSKKKKKQKKEKITYYDDNSTIADMSQVTAIGRKKREPSGSTPRKKSSFKDKWKTYWSAVGKMLIPMFAVLAILALIFLILLLIGQCA